MKNLASLISKKDVIKALEKAVKTKPDFNKATKYWLKYRGQVFPPKEIVRLAAIEHGINRNDFHNYRLNGGDRTNVPLRKLGFEIIPFADWKTKKEKGHEKRVARICWNTNGWIFPSGKEGKSRFKDSHEAKFGYGHEEWLFDIGKIIGGYHYGFLEPVRKQQQAFINNVFTIWLYTIDSDTKKRYWAGELFNVEVLTGEQADGIKKEYEKRGWLKEMGQQIKNSRANPKGFSNYKGIDLFNIRFKVADYKLNKPYTPLPKGHPVISQSRYSFGHFKGNYDVPLKEKSRFRFFPPGEIPETITRRDIKTGTHTRKEQEVQIVYLHDAISRSLIFHLRKEYGKNNVTAEHPAGYDDNRIDIVVKTKKGLIFYEIKTYPSVRTSIRLALGQVLEYAMWPDHNKAKELIIVTPPSSEHEIVRKYMEHLRNTLHIPVYWQSFDAEKNILSDKY